MDLSLSLLFSTLSGVFLLWGYLAYNKDIFRGSSQPNIISWGIWTTTTVLNMASYFIMTKDILKISLPIVETFACLFTFIYAFSQKKTITLISTTDKITLSIGSLALFGWWLIQSAVFANMVLQFACIAGFTSTYKSVWHNPSKEKLFPWTVFSLAYTFLLLTVISRWSGTTTELVSPVLGVVLHSGLAILIAVRTKSFKITA